MQETNKLVGYALRGGVLAMAMLLGGCGYAKQADVEDEIARLRQELQAFADEPGGVAVLAACQRFDDWLRNSDVRRGEAMPRMGRHNFAALVDACSGSELELDELRTKLLREVARLDLDVAREQVSVNLALMEEGRLTLRQVEESRVAESDKWIGFHDAEYAVERARLALLHRTGELSAALKP